MLSFSEKTKMMKIDSSQSLKVRLNNLMNLVGYNTNIELLLEELFRLCKREKVSQEDLPTMVIFSDMEFDQANYGAEAEPVFETYKSKFAEIGLTLPPVIFWNLCNRTGTVPLKTNEAGMMLCSGFSQQMMHCIVAKEFEKLDPWLMLKAKLDSPRYVDNDILLQA